MYHIVFFALAFASPRIYDFPKLLNESGMHCCCTICWDVLWHSFHEKYSPAYVYILGFQWIIRIVDIKKKKEKKNYNDFNSNRLTRHHKYEWLQLYSWKTARTNLRQKYFKSGWKCFWTLNYNRKYYTKLYFPFETIANNKNWSLQYIS